MAVHTPLSARTTTAVLERPGRRAPLKRWRWPCSARHLAWPHITRGMVPPSEGLINQLVTRAEKVKPLLTNQWCSVCGHTDAGSRESQADFRRVACGFACNADVNAARNITAGHAGAARGRRGDSPARGTANAVSPAGECWSGAGG